MGKLAFLLSLAVLALAFGSANGDWPDAPLGAIVAVAKLTSLNKNVVVRGSVSLIWPRQVNASAVISVNLTGALSQMTMAHIHQNTTGKPIRLDLLPLLNDTKPMPLNPPLSFRGNLGFEVSFDYRRVARWDPDNNFMNFIDQLREGKLFVNVHTVAQPGGVLQGKLLCKNPCMFPVCNPSPGRPC